MGNILSVRKPVVQVVLVILLLAVVAVVFTRAQNDAGPALDAVAYNTVRAASNGSDYYTLRVYGGPGWPKLPGNMGAGSGVVTDEITGLLAEAQPYTESLSIFNPQLAQAPRKDSITWNPIWMYQGQTPDENQSRGLYTQILRSGQDASEKVWFRMWYEPEHWDKDLNANSRLDRDQYGQPVAPVNPTPTGIDEWYPAIMQEFTYMLMEPGPLSLEPSPIAGQVGESTKFVFPVGMRATDLFTGTGVVDGPPSPSQNALYGYGLTSLDGNFDGTPDIVHVESELTLFDLTRNESGIAADFDGNGEIDPLDRDGVELSGDELVVLRLSPMSVPVTPTSQSYIQFLDHVVRVTSVYNLPNPGARLQIFYTGDRVPRSLGSISLEGGDMALSGGSGIRKIQAVSNGGPGTNMCVLPIGPGPFFVYLNSVDTVGETAMLMVGRALGATYSGMEKPGIPPMPDDGAGDPWFLKRFYVDGHEYNVVAIKTEGSSPQYPNDCDLDDDNNGNIDTAPGDDTTDFKFITVRTPIPKVPVNIEQHSVELQGYDLGDWLSVMPPYNYEHYIIEDVQAITAFDMVEGTVDYFGKLVGPVPPIVQANAFPYLVVVPGRTTLYDNQREMYLTYIEEDENPQFLGELKEKYGERFIGGGLAEENDPAVTRTGGFIPLQAEGPAHGGQLCWSNVTGDTVSYTFTGPSITLMHKTRNDYGIANITIDGMPYPAVDMYSAAETWQVTTMIASGLGPGSHTIEVEVSGNNTFPSSGFWVSVDAFLVGGMEEEFWYVEQWWTHPWEYTEFVLPDIGDAITEAPSVWDPNGAEPDPDLYLLTSAFTAPQSEYLYWIQDETSPLRYNLSSDFYHLEGQNTITATVPGWRPRVKLWFDPADADKTYKNEEGLRIFGMNRPVSVTVVSLADFYPGPGNTSVTDPVSDTYPVEVPPYTDPWAPFNPQLSEAPRVDSLTFNPAYMARPPRNGGEPLSTLYGSIFTENGDAREKVFLRMWYEPEYLDKVRVGTPITYTQVYTFPAVMQEFTYMLLDTLDRPSHGQPNVSQFAFPMATAADELPAPIQTSPYTLPAAYLPSFGYGLTTFDVNFDGTQDIVTINSEETISNTLTASPDGIGVDFDGNGSIDQLDIDGAELTGDELVVLAVEHITLERGESAMFLDHMITLDRVADTAAWFKVWYTGGGNNPNSPGPTDYSLHPQDEGTHSLLVNSIAVIYKNSYSTLSQGQNNLGSTDGPWFVYLHSTNVGQHTAEVTIGRALGGTHSAMDDGSGSHDVEPGDPWWLKRFFVDGHEYNVVAIKTVAADSAGEAFEFKYITIRTPVPKENFVNAQDSQKLEGYNLGMVHGVSTTITSVMPPFNFNHTRLHDIQKVEETAVPLGEVDEEVVFANTEFYTNCMGSLEGNVDPLLIRIVDEDRDEQLFGELKEKYWEYLDTEMWSTEQFRILPDQYTDLELPAGQLYLLTSAWESDQSWLHYYGCDPAGGTFTQLELSGWHTDIPTPTGVITFTGGITNTYFNATVTDTVRVKFWYDPLDSDDIYKNAREITPTVACQAIASSNSPVIEGGTIELYGGPVGMDTYSWEGPAGFSSSAISPTIAGATLAMAGTYSLTITTDGCTDTATTYVTVVPTDEIQGYLVPQHSGVLTYCNSTDVQIWVDADGFQGGQIKLQYDAACLTVTNYISNSATFPTGTWDSDTDGEEWITFSRADEITGTYNVVTLTLHCEISGCMTALDFVEDGALTTKLFDEWGVEIPGVWQDGSFRCGMGVCGDVAPYPGCNGAVDMGDYILLLNYVGHPGDYSLCCSWCGDVAPYSGCDGAINMGDYILLLNYVSHPGSYSLCCEGVISPPLASAVPVIPAAVQGEVNLVPPDSSAPFCETAEVEIRVEATDFQGGQIKLAYDPNCAEVTAWVSNTIEFPSGTWDSDTPGEEWITFAATGPMAGTYRIGTLTIHGADEEGCTIALDFVEDGPMSSKLFDDLGVEVPATWRDGTFRSGKAYKIYLPVMMKNSQ